MWQSFRFPPGKKRWFISTASSQQLIKNLQRERVRTRQRPGKKRRTEYNHISNTCPLHMLPFNSVVYYCRRLLAVMHARTHFNPFYIRVILVDVSSASSGTTTTTLSRMLQLGSASARRCIKQWMRCRGMRGSCRKPSVAIIIGFLRRWQAVRGYVHIWLRFEAVRSCLG